MKIVLAVDGSQFSVHTLAEIVTRFRAKNTEVLVLRVLQPTGPTPPKWNWAMLRNWRERKSRLIGWSSDSQRSSGRLDSRLTLRSRWAMPESASSIQQKYGRRSHRCWFAWTRRYPPFLARQRSGIRRSPRKMLCRDRSLPREDLAEPLNVAQPSNREARSLYAFMSSGLKYPELTPPPRRLSRETQQS